ncbi:MAG TPA: TetR/AcrR family transcriptional regulator, partial [Paraburkholderia sp.]|jgi:TetR/AcrR family transcriptional repressor of nem operon|nr:TetR/AcrR family transcriptional regulator [Paraburkholderia sp.]
MGHSQADKAASRERILEAAARQISERGLDSVSVGELMQNAGLTKGAFYAHFESRDEMIAEAARRAMQNGQAKLEPLLSGRKRATLKQIVDLWLDPAHVENRLDGCGICTLAGEARYAGPQVQRVVAEQFNRNVGQIAQALSGKNVTARATAILTAIVGAVSMSRAVGDPAMAAQILANTRALILQDHGEA